MSTKKIEIPVTITIHATSVVEVSSEDLKTLKGGVVPESINDAVSEAETSIGDAFDAALSPFENEDASIAIDSVEEVEFDFDEKHITEM